MGLVFMIVMGAILGWLAAIVMRAESRRGLTRNIGSGIAGALGAGLGVSPLVGGGSLLAESYSVTALLLALAGSILVIACANMVAGGSWASAVRRRPG